MIMKTKNYKHIEDGSRQESSHEQTTENGNRTEETQHGPSPVPPNIGATAKQGNTSNKRMRGLKLYFISSISVSVIFLFLKI
jgi:hypothetical protein